MSYLYGDSTTFPYDVDYIDLARHAASSGPGASLADDRTADGLATFYRALPPEELEAIEVVAMDMAPPFLKATQEHVPDAEREIVFDKFHVAQNLANAVSDLCKQENQRLGQPPSFQCRPLVCAVWKAPLAPGSTAPA